MKDGRRPILVRKVWHLVKSEKIEFKVKFGSYICNKELIRSDWHFIWPMGTGTPLVTWTPFSVYWGVPDYQPLDLVRFVINGH